MKMNINMIIFEEIYGDRLGVTKYNDLGDIMEKGGIYIGNYVDMKY